jgi:cell division protein FtsI/penicillin-binding protein 2
LAVIAITIHEHVQTIAETSAADGGRGPHANGGSGKAEDRDNGKLLHHDDVS